MSRDDWYRGPEWDSATREQFESKLARTRTQRAQYLRIKGFELTQADDPRVWEAGRELLRRVLNEHPDDEIWVLSAHHDLGTSYARERRLDEAVEHYEKSLELHRELPGGSFDKGASLALAEAIVEADWEHRFQDAADLLNEFIASRPSGLFPVEQFRVLLAEARMAARLGQTDVARRDAERALKLLAQNESVLPRHPGVGTITTDEETFRELERLASL